MGLRYGNRLMEVFSLRIRESFSQLSQSYCKLLLATYAFKFLLLSANSVIDSFWVPITHITIWWLLLSTSRSFWWCWLQSCLPCIKFECLASTRWMRIWINNAYICFVTIGCSFFLLVFFIIILLFSNSLTHWYFPSNPPSFFATLLLLWLMVHFTWKYCTVVFACSDPRLFALCVVSPRAA